MLCLLLASSLLAHAGPPALPPLPGEPSETTAPKAAPTEAAEPTTAPAEAGPPTQTPAEAGTPTQTPAPSSGSPTATPAPADPASESAAPVTVAAPTPATSEPAEPQPGQPTEVGGPPPSAEAAPIPAPTLSPAATSIEPVERPYARVDFPGPRRRGNGLLLGAGLVGAAGLGVKLWGTVLAASDGDPLPLLLTGLLYNPLIGTSVALTGAGMGLRGRYDAHQALFNDKPAPRPRRAILGWSLFGAGAGLWTLTRLGGMFACGLDECVTKVWEVGYYLSLAATVPGIIMGGYASGYNSYTDQHRGLVRDVAVAPTVGRDSWALSVSGRF